MSATQSKRQGSLATRLMWITVAVVTFALGVSSIVILRQFRKELRLGFEESTVVLSRTLAEHCQAPLVFQDAVGAAQVMSHMGQASHLRLGALYDSAGSVFARFGDKADLPRLTQAPSVTTITQDVDELTVLEPMFYENQRIGTLRLVASTQSVRQRERTAMWTAVIAMGLGIAAACLLGLFLQRGVTHPILNLARAMQGIRGSSPLQPVEQKGTAEIGVLYEGFNAMVARLEADRAARDSSESRLRALIGALPDPVFLLGEHGHISVIENELALQHPKDVTAAKRLPALLSQDTQIRARVKLALSSGQTQRWACEVETTAGTRWYDAVFVPLATDAHDSHDSKERLVLCVARDLTERHRLEEELRQSQKMDALGRLAGGVAHDFNNILTAITGYGELLQARLRADGLDAHDANEILRGADRAARLTRQLLAFSRHQVSSRQSVKLPEIIGDMHGMLARIIGEDVRLVTRFAADTPELDGDPGQLEQVVMNLVINARDAMPMGGIITVKTSGVPHAQGGEAAVLEVTDTGMGMDDQTRARIFEPFFTTKSLSGGTGLGLATVYGIVRSMNADIVVHSAIGEGATFRITFAPSTGQAQASRPRAFSQLESTPTRARILVVEDEAQLRAMVERVLSTLGFDVIVAANGEEGLRLFSQQVDAVDLVLADVVMPGMGGVPLMKALKQLRPQVKVVLMSGYADDVMVQHGVARGQVRFLSKPFTLEELRQQVFEALGKAAPQRS